MSKQHPGFTKKGFFKFLRENPDKKFTSYDSDQCPLAKFLKHLGVRTPQVESVDGYDDGWGYHGKGRGVLHELPPWAVSVVETVDHECRDEEGDPITAKLGTLPPILRRNGIRP